MYKGLPEYLFSIRLGLYAGVELLSHMVILRLTFWASAKLFSAVAAPFYIPTSSVQGFQFLHILVNIYYFPFFDDSHARGCDVVSRGFDLHFPVD